MNPGIVGSSVSEIALIRSSTPPRRRARIVKELARLPHMSHPPQPEGTPLRRATSRARGLHDYRRVPTPAGPDDRRPRDRPLMRIFALCTRDPDQRSTPRHPPGRSERRPKIVQRLTWESRMPGCDVNGTEPRRSTSGGSKSRHTMKGLTARRDCRHHFPQVGSYGVVFAATVCSHSRNTPYDVICPMD
jgi:hypothetical protein